MRVFLFGLWIDNHVVWHAFNLRLTSRTSAVRLGFGSSVRLSVCLPPVLSVLVSQCIAINIPIYRYILVLLQIFVCMFKCIAVFFIISLRPLVPVFVWGIPAVLCVHISMHLIIFWVDGYFSVVLLRSAAWPSPVSVRVKFNCFLNGVKLILQLE